MNLTFNCKVVARQVSLFLEVLVSMRPKIKQQKENRTIALQEIGQHQVNCYGRPTLLDREKKNGYTKIGNINRYPNFYLKISPPPPSLGEALPSSGLQ